GLDVYLLHGREAGQQHWVAVRVRHAGYVAAAHDVVEDILDGVATAISDDVADRVHVAVEGSDVVLRRHHRGERYAGLRRHLIRLGYLRGRRRRAGGQVERDLDAAVRVVAVDRHGDVVAGDVDSIADPRRDTRRQ